MIFSFMLTARSSEGQRIAQADVHCLTRKHSMCYFYRDAEIYLTEWQKSMASSISKHSISPFETSKDIKDNLNVVVTH
jgi:hypothetical protein